MTPRTRILVSGVVLGQAMGGVSRRARELLPRVAALLAERDVDLAVLEGRVPLPFALPAWIERIASRVPARPPIVRAVAEASALQGALREAADRGAPFALLDFGHLPVPRGLHVPYSLTIHDLRHLALRHTPMSRRLFAGTVIGRAVKAASVVVAPSESVRAELAQRWDLEPERTLVVPNAADHFEPLPRRAAAGAPLLHVGHIEPRKNLELLLRALAHDPGLPPLVLAGAPKGDEEERLRTLAAALGVAERVTFLGPFEDARLPELLAEAACVVMPSRIEGFGIPVLEALRAGAPLAIAETAVLREVAGPGVPGFSVEDQSSCAAAIRTAIAQHGASGVARATAYSWDEAARAQVDAWQRALTLPPPTPARRPPLPPRPGRGAALPLRPWPPFRPGPHRDSPNDENES